MIQLYFVLGYGMTFAHMLTYLANPCALSKMAGKEEEWHAVLQYAGVPKINKSEALLVRNCSKRLEEYVSHRINHLQQAKHLSVGIDQFRQVLSFWQLLEPWY